MTGGNIFYGFWRDGANDFVSFFILDHNGDIIGLVINTKLQPGIVTSQDLKRKLIWLPVAVTADLGFCSVRFIEPISSIPARPTGFEIELDMASCLSAPNSSPGAPTFMVDAFC